MISINESGISTNGQVNTWEIIAIVVVIMITAMSALILLLAFLSFGFILIVPFALIVLYILSIPS